MNILLIEDEPKTADAIRNGLDESGYKTDTAPDGPAGLRLLKSKSYQLVITDIIMPKQNGIDLCRQIRELYPTIPILFLTALNSRENLLLGFEAGADDYLTKPFDFRELLARIKALLRRQLTDELKSAKLLFADLEMNLKLKKVTRAGVIIDLTPKEFKLLEYFLRRPNEVLSRSQLARDVWNIDFNTGTNTVEVYLNYLRAKIDKPFAEKLIHNIHGVGYVLKQGNENT